MKNILFLLLALFLASCAPAGPVQLAPTASLPPSPTLTPSQVERVATLVTSTPTLPTPTGTLPPGKPSESPTPSPQPSPQEPLSVEYMQGQAGWAQQSARVLRTQDGGDTWTDVTPQGYPQDSGSLPSYAVFLSPDTAWYFNPEIPPSGQAKTSYGSLRTRDGGKTWQKVETPFNTARLLPVEGGLMAISRGTQVLALQIFQSKDDGDTWKLLYNNDVTMPDRPDQFAINPHQDVLVTFRSSYRGWALDYIYMGDTVELYTTGNTGRSWQEIRLALPPGYDPTQPAFAALGPVTLLDEQTAAFPAVLGSETQPYHVVVNLSQDGGMTFSPTTPLASEAQTISIPWSAPAAKDWFVSAGRQVYASHDLGRTWAPLAPLPGQVSQINKLYFADSQRGWVTATVDDANRAFRTRDGGQSWTEVKYP